RHELPTLTRETHHFPAPTSNTPSPENCRHRSPNGASVSSDPESSRLLVVRFIDLVERELVGDGSHRQAGDTGRAVNAPPGFFQGPTQVALLECGNDFGKLLRKRP